MNTPVAPKISVIIPVYNQSRLLRHTLESLKRQTFQSFEVIVVDDASSDDSYEVAQKYTKKVFKNVVNKGPAYNRNLGIKVAEADLIVFTDSDCVADEKWLEHTYEAMKEKSVGVIMGNTDIPKSTYLGDSISTLGFPAGGSIGFNKIWKVDENGLTDHISTCNVAIRKSILDKHGSFDESFPLAGGEDTELSHRYNQNGVKIKYEPKAKIFHIPRDNLSSFFKWQIYRGRSNYHIKKKLGKIGDFVKLRFWSSKNVLKHNLLDKKLPMVFFLLGSSFALQQYGYFKEKISDKANKTNEAKKE
ncbi:glycosyltransferase [Candidatus Woesearchaeota archaeon]|jgi:O-antigen biosynthesis protein|nr:glycosyltransferase [Candidatus Woesearchaeota archaeon]MBT5273163.1 glycosyltransferase [Candidatus Woesearchaeota archaeon]MBT6041274.1 glycosyltransferase [Candidatus Woesearchaeota archaeon]MBT6337522.1 glycosyltransferase [Candidatus Woesearchaeota archaeon]MBT7927077.1 glycosyltransferase [Candidatus Woesearchaeota archaeon]